MYGLKQAALLASQYFISNLKPNGYSSILHTDGLWKHKSRRIIICLYADEFGIKYFDKKCSSPHLSTPTTLETIH